MFNKVIIMNSNYKTSQSLAIIGSRGIPNRYGGFERFTETISTELAKRGHKIYVSCEYNPDAKYNEFKGVILFYFPFKPPKSPFLRIIYEFVYDIYSLFWASRQADYVYMLGYSAALFFFIPKILGKKLWVNPDGMEWKRSKFNSTVRFLLKLSEKISVFWADQIIADSKEIKKYFDSKYKIDSLFIPYGAYEIPEVEWDSTKLPDELKHINAQSYYLVVARLEPENNIKLIIEGYLECKTENPLIIIGDFADSKYESKINEIIECNNSGDKQVIFTGGIYDLDILNMIRQNCKAYIHGHSVGGTNPSLLEAMISKNLIIAHDNKFNREVCGKFAFYFGANDQLSSVIEKLEFNYDKVFNLRDKVKNRIKDEYNWINVFDEYEVFLGALHDK